MGYHVWKYSDKRRFGNGGYASSLVNGIGAKCPAFWEIRSAANSWLGRYLVPSAGLPNESLTKRFGSTVLVNSCLALFPGLQYWCPPGR